MEITCPKCGHESGDAWGQCEKKCPFSFSPHYDEVTAEKYNMKWEKVKVVIRPLVIKGPLRLPGKEQ